MFCVKSAWVICVHAARNRMARPEALIICPPVAEAFLRPRWTDVRTDKPNRIGVNVATDRVSAWKRGYRRRRSIGIRGRRSWRQTEPTLEGTFHVGQMSTHAVILHRMWRDGTDFIWSTKEAAA